MRSTDTVAPTALDFADAMAGRRSLRIHTGGNTYGRTIAWPASAPEEPFAVHVTDAAGRFRTVALDFDANPGAAAEDAAHASALLFLVGIDHVETISGPTGGHHILFTVEGKANGALVRFVADLLQSRFPTLDAKTMTSGTGCAIRPPLARHRHGGSSLLQGDPVVALDVLRLGNPPERLVDLVDALGGSRVRAEVLAATVPTRNELAARLNSRWSAVLTGMQTKQSGDCSRSGVLRSLLIALVNARFEWGEIAILLQDQARASVADRPSRGTWDHYLRCEYDKAAAWVRANPPASGPNDFRVHLAHISDIADVVAWRGTSGGSDLRVLQALLAVGLLIGRVDISASVRQLSWLTTLTPKTVGRAAVRLQERGWIERIRRGSDGIASVYRLRIPAAVVMTEYHNKQHTGGVCVPDVVIAGHLLRATQHDAFRHYPGAWRIHAHLDLVEAVPVRTLADRLGCSPSTAKSHLSRLRRWGLATRSSEGWVRVDRDLDDLAEERGTLGMTEEQQQRMREESTAYRTARGQRIETMDPTTGKPSVVYVLGAGFQ